MSIRFTESVVEDAALAWLADVGYTVAHGPDLAPGEPGAERASFGDVVLGAAAGGAYAMIFFVVRITA